jgi:hypothetical protein
MSRENEFDVEGLESAIIASFFREADQQFATNPNLFNLKLLNYLQQYGKVNFANFERVFRRNNFTIHLVAVPSNLVMADNPSFMVADVNDLYHNRIPTQRPFLLMRCKNLEDAQQYSLAYLLPYNQQENLARLALAGDFTDKPGFKGPRGKLYIRKAPFSTS